MDGRQATEVFRALALAGGDLRDWPVACVRCGSEELHHDPVRQVYHCRSCPAQMTADIVGMDREERARRDVDSGVGGPLLTALEGGATRVERQCKCGAPATQMHGLPESLIYTCDDCAGDIMAALIEQFVNPPPDQT